MAGGIVAGGCPTIVPPPPGMLGHMLPVGIMDSKAPEKPIDFPDIGIIVEATLAVAPPNPCEPAIFMPFFGSL